MSFDPKEPERTPLNDTIFTLYDHLFTKFKYF